MTIDFVARIVFFVAGFWLGFLIGFWKRDQKITKSIEQLRKEIDDARKELGLLK